MAYLGVDKANELGFIPLIAAAVTTGAGLYAKKKEGDQAKDAEKAAQKMAELQAAAARKAAKAQKTATKRWTVIGAVGGGILLIGVAAWAVNRRRK